MLISSPCATPPSHPPSWSHPPPPLSSFFLSVNTSGEEHKKGRVSELEGQQQGLWESHVSFVRAPERERGKKERKREHRHRGREAGMKWPFFSLLKSGPANEIMRGRVLRPSCSGSFLPLQLFIEGALFCCHVIIARKKNSGGGGEGGGSCVRTRGACKDSAS